VTNPALVALADKLKIELASKTLDGRFRTNDPVFVSAGGAIIAAGKVKDIADDGRTITVTTPVGEVTCRMYNLLHDATSDLTKERLTTVNLMDY
jgi:transcription elongation factor